MLFHTHGYHRKVPSRGSHLIAARCAGIDVGTDLRRLFGRERSHRVEREIVLRNVSPVCHALNAFRTLVSAIRILVFTVPSGSPFSFAISACVMPPKNASSTLSRCSAGI